MKHTRAISSSAGPIFYILSPIYKTKLYMYTALYICNAQSEFRRLSEARAAAAVAEGKLECNQSSVGSFFLSFLFFFFFRS